MRGIKYSGGTPRRLGGGISWSRPDGGVKVRVAAATLGEGGRVIQGDAVLVTVPLGCLKTGAMRFGPLLPEWKRGAIRR